MVYHRSRGVKPQIAKLIRTRRDMEIFNHCHGASRRCAE